MKIPYLIAFLLSLMSFNAFAGQESTPDIYPDENEFSQIDANPEELSDLGTLDYDNCFRVANLRASRNVDLLFCKISSSRGCFVTSNGVGVDCDYRSSFSYRASDYDSYDSCKIFARLDYDRHDDPYPVTSGTLEVCSFGKRSRAISCYVSSDGALDCP